MHRKGAFVGQPVVSIRSSALLEYVAMREVFLSSDVLIAYFRQPLSYEETVRHVQAAALMRRVYEQELTVHLTDITLFQVLKFLLEVDDSELAPNVKEDHHLSTIRRKFVPEAYLSLRASAYISRLLNTPNVIVSDREQWFSTLFDVIAPEGSESMAVHIEAAYNATAYVYSKNLQEPTTAEGIVSFEDQTIHTSSLAKSFPRIDPASFQ